MVQDHFQLNTDFNIIDTPALLIEKSIMENNISTMQALADQRRVNLRPHVKTHKIPYLAQMQLRAGAVGIAAAKLGEAEVMADNGISDIQIANIIVGDIKINRLLSLHNRVQRLTCCVDSKIVAESIGEAFNHAGKKMEVFIKIDTGFHRCGLENFDEILELGRFVCEHPGLSLAGILTHAGQVYASVSHDDVARIGILEGTSMVDLAGKLKKAGIEIKEISVGSTPAAAFSSSIPGVTELRPGNYIYHDMIQVSLGTVEISSCALSILACVVSVPSKDRAVIDAGSKALGLDKGAHSNANLPGYGKIMGHESLITRLSEEHGIISCPDENFRIGEKLRIIPNHACAVSNLFDFAWLVDGNTVIDKLPIAARGKSI